ncbi:GNAT family N-acetyltransferase [Erysipelothrix sp. HDW6A]|uniref:GNAT family N-acetyltransferase n=1 Tax=Erysipelothrix sp. HDW6A TaxID=2714928 RepID=UPI001409B622|nr:GNAT family N-acetyltransferase [Erysipelothrix sp. HDW6A]QIK57999.1 GNAT family N-acetyltransferase [Erysipelothrix sp. HDW6A]
MSVRKARVKDSSRILELLQEIVEYHHQLEPSIFRETKPKYDINEVELMIQEGLKTIFVYEEDGEVWGYLIGWFEDSYFFVDDLCVDKRRQGEKIGHKLMDACSEFEEVRLNVWAKNESGIAFYEREGYEVLKYVMIKRNNES